MVIKISSTNDKQYKFAKIVVLGRSGVGKTRFLGTVPEKEMLIINVLSESGMMTLKDKNIQTIDVDSYEDMLAAIAWVKKNGSQFSYIGIDSLSQFQKNMEKQIPEGDNKFAKWGTIKSNTKHIVDEFKRLPFHIVFTCELVKEKDEETGGTYYLPSLLGASKQDLEYWVDEVWYFTKRQTKIGEPILYSCVTDAAEKYPCKSRASLPMIIDNPNLAEITKMMFGALDKKAQKEELKNLDNFDKKRIMLIEQIREVSMTKDFDVAAFKKKFGLKKGLEDIRNYEIEDALAYIHKMPNKKESKVVKK